MKILVTRPLEDAEETARLLAARGHEALVAPLLATHFHDGPPLSLDGIQAVLATSANGVRALARRTEERQVPLFAVGPQTAQAAAEAGFAHVRNADGNAERLGQAAQEWADADRGPLLHVHGGPGPSALAAGLRQCGFTVKEEILYAVTPRSLPPDAIRALKEAALDAALFFSPRSAEVFREAALKDGLPTQTLTAICISAATSAALAPLIFAQTRVASAPNQAALLACLG